MVRNKENMNRDKILVSWFLQYGRIDSETCPSRVKAVQCTLVYSGGMASPKNLPAWPYI